VISHLDNSLETLLRAEVPLTSQECHVGFEIPDNTWETKIKELIASNVEFALNIYLYDVRENRKLRTNDRTVQYHPNNTVTEKERPARVDCFYLITAWKPQQAAPAIQQWQVAVDEHHLLSRVLQTLLRFPVLPSTVLQGDLAKLDPLPEIPTSVAQPDGMKNLGDFWNAVKSAWRPAIQYVVTIPFDLVKVFTAPLVASKIMRYGQSGALYSVQVRPSVTEEFATGSTLLRTTMTPGVGQLQTAANAGAVNISVLNTAALTQDDMLMVGSGANTEFCRLGAVAGTTIPIAPPLRHRHDAGTRLHRVVDGNAVGVLEAVTAAQTQTVTVSKETVERLHVGDVVKCVDQAHATYFQVTSISGSRAGLVASAETLIQIGGQVVETGAPGATLAGAQVTLVEPELNAITNAEGRFAFANLSPGEYHLRAQAKGYSSQEKTIQVPGVLGEYDMSLSPGP